MQKPPTRYRYNGVTRDQTGACRFRTRVRHELKALSAGGHELEVVAAIMYDMAVEKCRRREQNFSLDTREKVSLGSYALWKPLELRKAVLPKQARMKPN